ncbi:MAG: 3-phosphoshikimate 1-carboxyvinyltransferase [Bacteroidetes bacterium GWF2_43_63]|nr:MAG: 3-phosphoshikimate 1-carboxyvinyltransferase [Bacteroidetes bacterium GWE2_42_42]OFY52890.1 MAG: 3-phosphoshikimate 1-carboxyvinyltransferase [Bacteroidetes bacterium GWF2_43_63]
MIEQIQPYKIEGVLQAVASKSYLQRALAIAGLAMGPTFIRNYNASADAIAAQNIISKLGAKVRGGSRLHIVPGKPDPSSEIIFDADESGLSLRMFSFIAALYGRAIMMTGKYSLLARPVEPLVEALLQCGIQVKTTNGALPLTICGPISKNKIELDGSFSSHMLSGLLIAAPLLEHDTEISVRNLVSRPYIAMTLNIMRQFGVAIENNNFRQFYVKGRQQYQGQEYSIEGDWSAAANFLVGAAVSGKVEMTGLNQNSLQADMKIREILVDFGAHVNVLNNFISVSKNEARPFKADLTDCPDLFPPVVVLAAAANGASVLTGTQRLIHKESNRFKSLLAVFSKLGLKLEPQGNDLHVFGVGSLQGGEVDSFNDHRIAMCAAIAATLANSEIKISNAEAVSKSYPDFFADLRKVMAK